MQSFRRGQYEARLSKNAGDVVQAQRLRHLCFAPQGGVPHPDAIDTDAFDDLCSHGLVENLGTGQLLCCFRTLVLPGGADITASYSAQYYDLSPLTGFPGPLVELGRFCIHPDCHDPDVLRIAFALLTGLVDRLDAKLLFGCASFRGTDTAPYQDSFEKLREQHLAPPHWQPRVKSPEIFPFGQRAKAQTADPAAALKLMPPLLRTYLGMGGWVSDHAVIDRQMQTLHVFTGVEIAEIPPARARLLRAIAG